MTPTHALKKGARYRYYVSRRLITGVRGEAQHDHGQRLPAGELERFVVERIKTFFADAITEVLPPQRRSALDVKRALAAAADIVKAIVTEGDGKAFFLLRPLVGSAQVHLDRIDVDLRADQVAGALLSSSIEDRFGPKQDDERERDAPISPADDGSRLIPLTVVAELKRSGMEMKFVQAGVDEGSPDAALVRLLFRAHSLARRMATNPSSTLEEVGAQEGMGAPYAARLMRLNFLAPDIVVAMLTGRQPVALTARQLMADTRLPLTWSEQRTALGFA